jgi:hypothetical protein
MVEFVASHIWRDETAPDLGHPFIYGWSYMGTRRSKNYRGSLSPIRNQILGKIRNGWLRFVVSHVWRDETAPDMGHPFIYGWSYMGTRRSKNYRGSWYPIRNQILGKIRNGWLSVWSPTSGAIKLRQIWGTQSFVDGQTWATSRPVKVSPGLS